MACVVSRAQVFIINDNVTAGRLANIEATVVDSLTSDPVSFASVYVIPAKDTTITNFTLSDTDGKAKLEDVPYGEYVFHVEMLGYKPFISRRYFRDWRVDMGTIKLQIDENYLKAAVVTDVGNPIVVKQDTVEFNASSFQVGANAMLKDLLMRMPGMEITEDGKVKFNGEEIDKLTVGGRTFFFGDQSTALNNLPASIVDKIRVIDRESESTRATGLQDGTREKVLDVGLKKEYEKGWFGNAGVKGGTTLARDGKNNPLRDDRGLLYSGNVLASAYSEKDQLTLIGNGMNVNEGSNVVVVVFNDGEEVSSLNQGLVSAAQAGINYNTSRIKDVETTAGANYKYSDVNSGTKTFRTTFQDGGDILSSSSSYGRSFGNSVTANGEMQKEKGNVMFHVRPGFSYNRSEGFSEGSAETSKGGQVLNSSENHNHILNTTRNADLSTHLSFVNIGGEENRSLSFLFNGDYGSSNGSSSENNMISMASGVEGRVMDYVSQGSDYSARLTMQYGEPIGEKWLVSASGMLGTGHRASIRNAFDAEGKNAYYSSESNSKEASQRYMLTAQYKFKDKSWIIFGARLNGSLQETYSKSFNISETTGAGEWNWHISPELRFQHTADINRYYGAGSGYISNPSRTRMLPSMNITDPSRPTLGNIHLRPYGTTSLYANWDRNDRKRFSTLMVTVYGSLTSNPITYASWYDPDGILYSIPVNSRKKSISGSSWLNYMTPLDSKKKWNLTSGIQIGISSSTSYQAKGTLPGLDKDSFDYSSFMSSFWGGNEGDIFYSGKSGFAESSTTSLSPSGLLTVSYNDKGFSAGVTAKTSGRIVKYSLNPAADMNTLDSSVGGRVGYTTKHEWEFKSDLNYAWYNGYSAGYGTPEWQWNAEISKSIKAFNFSIKLKDILDQTRNLTHTVTANYEEDTYRLVMGRYILFGIRWNFGKMNAAHNQRAQQAAWNMVF